MLDVSPLLHCWLMGVLAILRSQGGLPERISQWINRAAQGFAHLVSSTLASTNKKGETRSCGFFQRECFGDLVWGSGFSATVLIFLKNGSWLWHWPDRLIGFEPFGCFLSVAVVLNNRRQFSIFKLLAQPRPHCKEVVSLNPARALLCGVLCGFLPPSQCPVYSGPYQLPLFCFSVPPFKVSVPWCEVFFSRTVWVELVQWSSASRLTIWTGDTFMHDIKVLLF